MMKWHVGFVIPTIGLFVACSSAPKTPVVSTEFAPPKSAAATNSVTPVTPVAPVTPEPSATVVADKPQPKKEEPIAKQDEEESEDEGFEGGVPGGIAGGPRFDAVVGVPGGVVGGVVGGVPGGGFGGVQRGIVGGNAGLGMPDDVLMPGSPLLTQKACPRPDSPAYPKAAKDAKVEATIVAQCIAEKNGSLACKLIKSHPLFEKPLMDHLNTSKVPPMTTTDGKPARVRCIYTYRFKLE